jgi:aminodeoxyfutalosine deaminase
MRHYDDFRQVVVDYAEEAARHGAVYIEGIFSPIERVWRGVDWDEIFAGYCDGAAEARERHNVEVRLTPDITRGAPVEEAFEAVRYSVKYQGCGIVGIGLGGEENLYPPEPFAPAFRAAKEDGLASVPHAGEVVGASSVRGALEALEADRIRHGHPRSGRSGAGSRDRRPPARPRRLPDLELKNGRRALARRASAAAARRGRRPMLDLDR